MVKFKWAKDHFTSKEGTVEVMHCTTAEALGELGEIVERNVHVQLKGKFKNEKKE